MCRGLESVPFACLERAKELKVFFGSLLHTSAQSIVGRSQKTKKLRSNRDEPLKWKESFEKLIASQNGLCLFRTFLVSEFSEENIAFYLACEDYRLANSAGRGTKAKQIYDEFICDDAPREVNLDHETKAATKGLLDNPTESSFKLAQSKIYTLMEKDCYPRFLKSSVYLELSRQVKTR